MAERQKVFKYTKKEIRGSLLSMLLGVLFLFFGVYEPRSKRFTILTESHLESIFMTFYYVICFIIMFYFFHLWRRRRSFLITVDDSGLTLSRFDKIQRVEWGSVKSYVYQGGRPYWFISLNLTDGKRINIHGKLENFEELIELIKNKTKSKFREFQYTVRKKISIMIAIYCISGGIFIIIAPFVYWLYRRIPLFDVLGFIILAVALFGGGLFINLRESRVKVFVNDVGLTMKPWLGKPIFIPWPEMKENSQIEFGRFQSTIVARIKKINIRVQNKLISFCEDLDNFDELVNIIETKTGISLRV